MASLPESIGLRIISIIRSNPCPHGIQQVEVEGTQATILCGECILLAIRQMFDPLASACIKWGDKQSRKCRHCDEGKIRMGFGGRHGYGPPINCPVCHGTGRAAEEHA